jgi:hypothetical protein
VSDIEWADPPPSGRSGPRRSRVRDVVDQLKQRPGQWAIVSRSVTASATTNWKRHGCETRMRRTEPGSSRVDIYARWPVGGDS